MSFTDDANRWEQLLYHLNILSANKYSGAFVVYLNDGRVSRATLKEVNDLARPYVERVLPEESHARP